MSQDSLVSIKNAKRSKEVQQPIHNLYFLLPKIRYILVMGYFPGSSESLMRWRH